ncbi:zinc finger and BTB domain-containing protein 41 isoform X2 [Rhipicephalus microplus]|nr:zinc finger protein 519-like [Rhipicephalus microplus]
MPVTALRNIMPRLVPPGTQGSGVGTQLNTQAYMGDSKEQHGSYNSPQHGSDSPRVASNQSRKRGNFKCRYCGRTFVYMTPFIAHEYAHANEKRFLCSFCPQGFVTRQLLTVHLRVHKDEILANDDPVP